MTVFESRDIVNRIVGWYRDDEMASRKWRREAKEAFAFYAGDQWSEADKAKMEKNDRPVITFNRVAPVIDSISGAERANRQEVRYLPRGAEDAAVGETFSAAGKWVRDECDAEDEESEAFVDAAVCGMGWTETFVDFQEELDGKICVERISPLEMFWDCEARKRNLTDARRVHRLKIMPRNEVKQRFGTKRLLVGDGTDMFPKIVDEPHDAEAAQFYREDQGWRRLEQDEIPVLQTQWWELVPVWRMLNPKSGQIEALAGEEYDALKAGGIVDDIRVRWPDAPEPVRQVRKRYFQAFIAGRTLLHKEELHPTDDAVIPGFTFRPITGKRDETKNDWFGVMRGMIDPQRWSNKFFSLILEIIRTNAKGGLMAEEGAFVNKREAEDNWARPDSITWVNPGALSGEKPSIQPKPAVSVPPGLDRMMLFAISSIRDVTGVNLELMGMAERTQAGVVESARIRQGMLTLATLFDSLRRYRKEQGRVLLHMIRKYVPPQTMVRVVGEERYVPFAHAPGIARFDIVVDQSPTSPNMKAEVWEGLKQILPPLLKAGLPLPPDILDFSPLPNSVIVKFKRFYQSMQPTPQQRQRREMAEDLQVRQLAADVKETEAAAMKNMATAHSNVEARKLDRERAAGEMRHAGIHASVEQAGVLLEAARIIVDALTAQEQPKKDQADE